MEQKKITQKWGFGLAPLKSNTECNYRVSVNNVNKFLNNIEVNDDELLNSLSTFKGMVNRIVKQDQWDWFTVYEMFGEPDIKSLKRIVSNLIDIRKRVKNSSETIRFSLDNYKEIRYISEIFLGHRRKESDENGKSGYIYLLSTRENPDIIKIGMTTRQVVQRVKEINSATGVVIPYSPRSIYKVKDASIAEKMIFDLLKDYRVRSDREFFNIDYKDALVAIDELLGREKLVYEHEYALVVDNYIDK